jgi:hypothetical protein
MAIKKKEIDTDDYLKKYSSSTKYKEQSFYNCGDAFVNALGVPGPVKGGINMLLGHSNTSKTTALVLSAADAQKNGDLPVLIITERKWSWEYALKLGFKAEQDEDGEWFGDFIYNDSFEYIEQATDFLNKLIDDQISGKIKRSMVFLWDSVGSIPCKMTYEGKGGKEHNAAALADKIGQGLNNRISKSCKADYPYWLTLIVVNQSWVERPDNPFGQPQIKAKGGNSIWSNASFVFLFGLEKKAGINHITATKNGRTIVYAIRTRISLLKNHVNGLSLKDSKIISVHNGFIDDTKEALDKYKREYSHTWNAILGEGGTIVYGETEETED